MLIIRGLSPRVRGNQLPRHQLLGMRGSIPACAGEPRSCAAAAQSHAVYPRVCGGTRWGAFCPSLFSVYPRVCEGTGVAMQPPAGVQGLSPRVRGNLLPPLVQPDILRSIPACAGEPSCGSAGRSRWWVYPRVCGEPPRRRCSPITAWVYPRVCGGTLPRNRGLTPLPGLSPRVRGNPAEGTSIFKGARSIPACAGEPCMRKLSHGRYRVYPRVCGGTAARSSRRQARRVYPRVCGGTARPAWMTSGHTGLSPRVRGNPRDGNGTEFCRGSIPACAGEPA